MNQTPLLNAPVEVVAAIRETLSKAYSQVLYWDQRSPEGDEKESAKYFVERAFTETLVFLEAAGLPNAVAALSEINKQAKANYARCVAYSDGLYLMWAERLEAYLSAIEATFVREKSGRVMKEIVDQSLTATVFRTLRKTRQTFIDVLKLSSAACFPDLRPKPPIRKTYKKLCAGYRYSIAADPY